jgi:hypothetical protein
MESACLEVMKTKNVRIQHLVQSAVLLSDAAAVAAVQTKKTYECIVIQSRNQLINGDCMLQLLYLTQRVLRIQTLWMLICYQYFQ